MPPKPVIIPEQIKDLIGQLVVATAKSTDPANKISLTSSRISFDLAAMLLIYKEKVPQGLLDTIQRSLNLMIGDMMFDDPRPEVAAQLLELKKIINDNITSSTTGVYLIDALDAQANYNLVLQCRARWKIANDKYMENTAAWYMSNKMLADIHDVLTSIELTYGLITVPKNVNWDVSDFGYHPQPQEQIEQPQQG